MGLHRHQAREKMVRNWSNTVSLALADARLNYFSQAAAIGCFATLLKQDCLRV
jgi:hypothetical protein